MNLFVPVLSPLAVEMDSLFVFKFSLSVGVYNHRCGICH
jgi:hypothetical protein